MKRSLLILLQSFLSIANAQNFSKELNSHWQFRKQHEIKWYKANVPGTVHTDLLANKLIPDPFFRDNESKLQWIDTSDWEYRNDFTIDAKTFSKKNIDLVFEGLDTYADVYLNGKLILKAENMFREWALNVKRFLKRGNNELLIIFSSAQNKVDSIAISRLPLVLPDNNRVYARKAQFQFGWDWGPKFVGCGIWKKIRIDAYDWQSSRAALQQKRNVAFRKIKNKVELIEKNDSIGRTFYFSVNGKPIFCKGANWIPADIFLPRVRKEDYRALLQRAKEANMNMLRVWGGGIYEDDYFYDLCDEMGIMVWQDFMFAGGMYPGDEKFFENIKAEVKYQVERLRHHPSIVLWCGNNEIDEAWHHWGWQQQYNLHGNDSTVVWGNYTRLFRDSLRLWVNEFDGTRPYISTSPKYGWGNPKSYKEGDSHYWGLWWGLEGWEKFEEKTGRFVSEYGMQAMPGFRTTQQFTNENDRYLFSPVINAHQKAAAGFNKLNYYLQKYFVDTSLFFKKCKVEITNTQQEDEEQCLEDYTYLSQCLQYYILRNSIITHRNKAPATMGTLLWQLNDCWPVTSWSITDYNREPKAGWFAVKESYTEMVPLKDSVIPKAISLRKPAIKIELKGKRTLLVSSDVLAKYVYLSIPGMYLHFSDNYFDLKPGVVKSIDFVEDIDKRFKEIKVKTYYDVQMK